MTSAKTPEKKKDRPKRKWLKRFGLFLACLLLLLVIFHQPILMVLIRFGLARFAASQHAVIRYEVEGRAISGLVFKNVQVTPTGKSPVDKITVDRLRLTYSLLDLLWHGQRHFLKSVEAANVSIALRDINDPTAPPRPPEHFDRDLHSWLFPAVAFAGKIDVRNVDIVNHLDVGDFILQSGNIAFEHGKPGTITIARMKIPALAEWDHIEGRVTVTDSDLTIEGLKIAPGVTVNKLISTPSPDDVKKSLLTVDATAFGGSFAVEYSDAPQGAGYEASAHISATKTGLDGLGKFLESPIPMSGAFDHIDIQCGGHAGNPSSWTGNSSAVISAPAQIGPVKVDQGSANLVGKNGTVSVEGSLSTGAGKLSGSMQGAMPGRLRGFPGMGLDGHFQVAVPDLSRSSATFTHGSVAANGDFHLLAGQFQTEFVATGAEINSERFDASAIDVKAGLSKRLDSGFPDDIAGRITAQFKDARLDKYALDAGVITAEDRDGHLHFEATNLKRAQNTAAFTANIFLPSDPAKIRDTDFEVNFSVSAPNVAAFNAEPDLNGLNGEFQASGTLARRNGNSDGKINIDGGNLVCGDFKAESVKVDAAVEKSLLNVRNIAFVMNPKNRLDGSGSIGLRRPYAYQGNFNANISDITVFDPLFASMNIYEPVGGAIAITWDGNGEFEGMHHRGQGQLKLTGGRYGKFLPITAEISGTYSPESVDIPTFHVHVDKTDFVATATLRDTELDVRDILLQQGKIKLLQGEIIFPVDLRTPANTDSLVPPHGRAFANLSSDEINLDTLLVQPKQTSPLKGTLKLAVNADGPLDQLQAGALLTIRNLQVKATPAVQPGNLNLQASLKDNQLTLHGAFQQPVISPLQIDGMLPFSIKQLLKDRKIDEQSPIALSLKLDKCPATIISQIEPRIRYLEGQMGIDARAAGTIARPQLSGAVSLDMPAIRLRDPTAPAVNGFKANMEFTGNQLVIRRCGGEVSGGPFDFTGRILFEKLTTPKLDMRFTSQNLLALRNETLTIRLDSDLKIAGPFNAASVTGSVGLTKSRFFRDVEILPISLPGKPAPKPPTEVDTGFSLKPPFAKWTFNVALKTKDPFLVRGNLANGAVHIDLRLLGTGESPTLDGMARIDNFVASLPFSRLNIEYGYAYFSADSPFMPKLDIQGTSSLRDYNIHVYITGTPSDPVTVLTSDPPLPQEQIVALLGTGATAQELTGNSDVLAGRAAILLLQDLYHKVFKRNNRARENQSFLTRFELNPGAIDPRTGRQEVSARFKATDQVYLLGDIDEQGGVSGQVGYLIRFR